MPDSNEIHLPDFKWAHVYAKMVGELKAQHNAGGQIEVQIPTQSSFGKIRIKRMGFIKIRKFKRFAKCKICTTFEQEIRKAVGFERKTLIAKKEEHNDWQMRERQKYYKHREKAWRDPQKYVCISIDGMDNSKTNIGTFAHEDKETAKAVKLKTHLTGVLMHGRPSSARVYTWFDRFPQGTLT